MIKGIDVSKWDVQMDWSKYDWPFAFIKVSEGTVIDPLFTYHWNGARGRTFRGGYHFFRPSIDPKISAQRVVDYLGEDRGELPLMFDLEATDGRTDVLARAKSWVSWYEEITGVRPFIYSNEGFLVENRADLNLWLENYKLHLAQYRYDNLSVDSRAMVIHNILMETISYSFPPVLYPFKRMPFVQWTAKGAPKDVPGYYTGTGSKLAVDFNFYDGTVDEFETEFGLKPPEPPTGEPMQYGKVIYPLNIRKTPDTTYAPIGSLQVNDLVEASTEINGWWKLSKITRNGTNIVLPATDCYSYEGASNGYIQELPPPTTVTHIVKIFKDGSIQVDDQPVIP